SPLGMICSFPSLTRSGECWKVPQYMQRPIGRYSRLGNCLDYVFRPAFWSATIEARTASLTPSIRAASHVRHATGSGGSQGMGRGIEGGLRAGAQPAILSPGNPKHD